MCKENGDIPHAAEYGKYPEAWWNKPDWLKIWWLLSDPHSVMPLIKLIIGASVPSVPSLNCTHTQTHAHTHTHTNLVLLSEIALSLLSLYCVSLQLVEPHFELPQALSLLSLGGRDGGGVVGWTTGWEDGHGNWGSAKGKWKTNEREDKRMWRERVKQKDGGEKVINQRDVDGIDERKRKRVKERACTVKHVCLLILCVSL